MARLFGTDGIRGKANYYPMTCEIALGTGRAVGTFAKNNGYKTVIIGKDTRISGDMLEAALASGITSTGMDVLLAGVIPTPGIAFLCSDNQDAGAGIVISASHNPFYDNGIKIFKHDGTKLSHKEEIMIETLILDSQIVSQEVVGKIAIIPDGLQKYSDFLLSKFPFKKLRKKLKIIVDCSNGAASKISHLIFDRTLFEAQFISDLPNGTNINDNCGSQHTIQLQKRVLMEKADLGLAFDGDADRLIAIDEAGAEITGDKILSICAKYAKENNKLKNNIVVSTIMSNMGLTEFLSAYGIQHIRVEVGDRRVLEEMQKCDAVIGGEDSGHMIFLDNHTTGDGMLSALRLMEVILKTKQPLSKLASEMTVYPQVLINIEVAKSKPEIMKNSLIADTIKAIEEKLGKNGRVLIRYSGTQPLLRVMVEGPDQKTTEQYCKELCDCIRANI
ncbi:MAG: phosphoglucosamine mutase [Desulfobacterales bacterium RIFOXYA12_FULL_46_15]|nr:MAG: phosphoglucosamine mutase [Desulfobacterales bacterium RIFOXYA12_FULL_46_15]